MPNTSMYERAIDLHATIARFSISNLNKILYSCTCKKHSVPIASNESMRIFTVFLAVATALLPLLANAAPTDCPEHFALGAAPEITNSAMQARTRELCFSGFAVQHSGVTRTPLWSAEHLTRARLETAATLPRINSFHAESRLPPADRANLADYKGSGYDRGHMSPNHDMPTPSAQQASFSLANMIPQARKINQNLWEGIESAVRDAVDGDRGLYVITGPIFEGSNLEQLNGRVLVPTSVFKAIYDPAKGIAGAYVVTNAKESRTVSYETMTIAALEKRVGINLFPKMAPSIKTTPAHLPAPRRHHGKR